MNHDTVTKTDRMPATRDRCADLQRGVCVLQMRAAIGSDSEVVADREIYVARAV